ncbi:MAG: hypothetical protein C0504_13165 [Candidatus Solibacter sp.]|nr:hypothetical protein [Candidatus Solibacter sp.]
MCRLLIAAALILCCASTTQAQALSRGERDRAMSELHASRKAFIDIAGAASRAQLSFKPAPGAWSIMEIAEHLALTEPFLAKLASGGLGKPADPGKLAQTKGKDASILTGIADRNNKSQAPAMLLPKAAYKTRDAVIAAFKESRDANIAYIRDTSDPLRACVIDAGGSPMDCYQVYLMIAAHTHRHISQMKEVMANPAYPKK